jgi:signal transduction histidine kinase
MQTLTMDNTEQIQELRRRLEMRERQLNALHEINAVFFSQKDLDQGLEETLHILLETVDAAAGSLLLYDKDKRKLVFDKVVGKTELLGQEIDPEADRTGRASEVFRTGQSILTLDTRKEDYNRSFDDGTGFQTLSILTVPLKNIGGEIIGVLQALNKRDGSFTDEDRELLEIVSGQAATSIVNARLAQEAQLAAVARAVGDLSHDIKNALTPVETAVETLIQTFIEPMFDDVDKLSQAWKDAHPDLIQAFDETLMLLREEYPYTRSSVQDGCTDIRELVSEIADYIKGTQATHMEVSDLGEVVRERLRRLEILSRQRRVTLHMDGLENVPPFRFDRRLLGRAIYNLVNNALGAINDAVKKGTLEYRSAYNVWIRASVERDGTFPNGGYCQIEVEDDGAGISPHVKSSLFTPNAISTTPGGTGIGTRFVKDVADRHGGIVGVESEFGHGAKFWMRLPLHQE